jgi:hypothetical protein
MENVWSGTIIYEWTQEANDYGLTEYGVNGSDTSGTPTPLADYTNLSKQWATLTPKSVQKSKYTPSITTPVCPSSTASGWPIDPSIGPPTIEGLNIATVKRVTAISPTSSATTTGHTKKSSKSASGLSASGSAAPADTNGSAQSGGLSSAAKIAIGVTIPVAVLILAAISFFAIRRHRKRKASTKFTDVPTENKPELGGAPVSQLDSETNQVKVNREELDSRPVRFRPQSQAWELPGDERLPSL